jgi:hypothetical protein
MYSDQRKTKNNYKIQVLPEKHSMDLKQAGMKRWAERSYSYVYTREFYLNNIPCPHWEGVLYFLYI